METQTTSNTNVMEPISAFLPLTRTEMIFLESVLNSFPLHEFSSELRMKIQELREETFQKYTPEFIVDSVCKVSSVSVKELKRKGRRRDLYDIRACTSKIIKDYHPNISLKDIGWYINRDHATVHHHLENVPAIKELHELYQNLKSKITEI